MIADFKSKIENHCTFARPGLPTYIILIASAWNEKIPAFYIYNDAHGANIEPGIERILQKACESKRIAQKNLENRAKKANYHRMCYVHE